MKKKTEEVIEFLMRALGDGMVLVAGVVTLSLGAIKEINSLVITGIIILILYSVLINVETIK